MSLLRQRLHVVVHHRLSMIAAFLPVLFDDPIVWPKQMTCPGWETRYPEQRQRERTKQTHSTKRKILNQGKSIRF
jgi:hypothetical protein